MKRQHEHTGPMKGSFKKLTKIIRPKMGMANVVMTILAVFALFPLGAYGGTSLKTRGSSSVYIDAYVNFVAATTFELFQMLFTLTRLPKGDIGIGTNSIAKAIETKEDLGRVQGASVAIKGIQGEVVQISCARGGTLSNGRQKLPISNVEVAAGKRNTGDFGQGIACNGQDSPALSHVLNDSKDDNMLFIGVRLQVNDQLAASRYSTSNPMGEPVAFEINYI